MQRQWGDEVEAEWEVIRTKEAYLRSREEELRAAEAEQQKKMEELRALERKLKQREQNLVEREVKALSSPRSSNHDLPVSLIDVVIDSNNAGGLPGAGAGAGAGGDAGWFGDIFRRSSASRPPQKPRRRRLSQVTISQPFNFEVSCVL